ncbi:hypothetical protein KSW81_007345 [Nannochloris sp. 'desiccata']|nr:hypothetical protein KSW81_007345 [Chlorella desiccata (nom. nud.)]
MDTTRQTNDQDLVRTLVAQIFDRVMAVQHLQQPIDLTSSPFKEPALKKRKKGAEDVRLRLSGRWPVVAMEDLFKAVGTALKCHLAVQDVSPNDLITMARSMVEAEAAAVGEQEDCLPVGGGDGSDDFDIEDGHETQPEGHSKRLRSAPQQVVEVDKLTNSEAIARANPILDEFRKNGKLCDKLEAELKNTRPGNDGGTLLTPATATGPGAGVSMQLGADRFLHNLASTAHKNSSTASSLEDILEIIYTEAIREDSIFKDGFASLCPTSAAKLYDTVSSSHAPDTYGYDA